MKRKLSIIISVILAATLTLSVSAAVIAENAEIQKRLEAGDVCGLVAEHSCDSCSNTARGAAPTSCPQCGSTMYEYCSGVRVINYEGTSPSNYFVIPCYVGSHDADCKTVQSRFWTDYICDNCGLRQTNMDWHIQAYYHLKHPEVADNHYCSLLYVPRTLAASVPADPTAEAITAVNKSTDDTPRDPIAAADFSDPVFINYLNDNSSN